MDTSELSNLPAVSLANAFKNLYNERETNGNTTDFVVICKNGQRIAVHSFVLRVRYKFNFNSKYDSKCTNNLDLRFWKNKSFLVLKKTNLKSLS